jgi:type II secretory pathway component PulF
MAMLLRSEVALPDAARLAASAVPNVVLAERLGNLAEFVDSGEGFAEALVESKALPRTVAWRIWASWYRSELADELSSLAGDLRTQLDDQERAILSLTRPLAILLAGFALTPLILLIVAMYLPMFMLVSLIG